MTPSELFILSYFVDYTDFSAVSFFKLLNELVAVDVIGGKPVLRGHKAQGGGKVGLTHARRAEEDHVFSVFQKTHGGQFVRAPKRLCKRE